MANPSYVRPDYTASGFNAFFSRSIDAHAGLTLPNIASDQTRNSSREINYDQSQTSGALGSIIRVGTIELDGVAGKIAVYEGSDEVVRIGELDG